MNGRRAFVRVMSLALIAPVVARAQAPAKPFRVGILHGRSAGDANVAAFLQGMRDLGYREGDNARFEFRWAEGRPERLPGLASELVAQGVDVIFTATTTGALAAKGATSTIPIVFVAVADPVGTGIVANLPHPPGLASELVGQRVDVIFTATTTGALAAKGATSTIPIVFVAVADPVGTGVVANLAHPPGNITGLSHIGSDLSGKILELLKETLPGTTRVAVIAPVGNPAVAVSLRNTEKGATSLGLRLQVVSVRSAADFGPAFQQIRRDRPDALYAVLDTLTLSHGRDIAEFASRYKLPSIYGLAEFVDAGGLMSYGTDFPAMYRRAATYVDKILRGAKPGDLPVEQPVKFELVINMKTAKALGVTIPQSVLFRADRVIE